MVALCRTPPRLRHGQRRRPPWRRSGRGSDRRFRFHYAAAPPRGSGGGRTCHRAAEIPAAPAPHRELRARDDVCGRVGRFPCLPRHRAFPGIPIGGDDCIRRLLRNSRGSGCHLRHCRCRCCCVIGRRSFSSRRGFRHVPACTSIDPRGCGKLPGAPHARGGQGGADAGRAGAVEAAAGLGQAESAAAPSTQGSGHGNNNNNNNRE